MCKENSLPGIKVLHAHWSQIVYSMFLRSECKDVPPVNTDCLLFHVSPEVCLSVRLSFSQGSQHSGSSLSLASTKVCSSMDEGDGPSSECTTDFFF